MKLLSKLIFWVAGWKLKGSFPSEIKKCVVIAAPHTSNWDFIYALPALSLWGVKIKYLIKNDFWVFPFSLFFKATGGIPVNRTKSTNFVQALANIFNEYEDLKMIIPPEGTRSRVDKWKTGFYHVAVTAKVPIMLAYLDYEKKIAGVEDLFWPSGDLDKDFHFIQAFYQDKVGANPDWFNKSIF